jgi:hypothetical protein
MSKTAGTNRGIAVLAASWQWGELRELKIWLEI